MCTIVLGQKDVTLICAQLWIMIHMLCRLMMVLHLSTTLFFKWVNWFGSLICYIGLLAYEQLRVHDISEQHGSCGVLLGLGSERCCFGVLACEQF